MCDTISEDSTHNKIFKSIDILGHEQVCGFTVQENGTLEWQQLQCLSRLSLQTRKLEDILIAVGYQNVLTSYHARSKFVFFQTPLRYLLLDVFENNDQPQKQL